MAEINKTHPEWTEENSLTSPLDRKRENKWRPNQGAPSLSEEEVKNAMATLNNNDYVNKFPKVERTYADPPINLQNYGLISFVPAKGAKPNQNGVYGFAKLRGNYASEMEADERAEFLIRNVDSYHQIYHTYVGRPFPITFSSDYSAETKEIDIRRETTDSISSNIKKLKEEEKRETDDIKQREQALLDESKSESVVDPYEHYITLRVKKAQLLWTYQEHLKKMEEVKSIIIKTRSEIADLDTENPEFDSKYLQKYMDAREKAGIKETAEEMQNNFMKFLVEDFELDF